MFGRRPSAKARSSTPADLLVIGLGNPGPKYEGTLHNAGVDVLRVLAERHDGRLRKSKELALVDEIRVEGSRVVLAFPQTFMNDSGRSAGLLVRRHGVEDLAKLVVVHDELDLPLGRLKVKFDGGLAGHNGLKSIHNHLHTAAFGRVRLGVGPPAGRPRDAKYLLNRPSKANREELDILAQHGADAIELILAEGYQGAMARFNAN